MLLLTTDEHSPIYGKKIGKADDGSRVAEKVRAVEVEGRPLLTDRPRAGKIPKKPS
jgi:hypothetical protein